MYSQNKKPGTIYYHLPLVDKILVRFSFTSIMQQHIKIDQMCIIHVDIHVCKHIMHITRSYSFPARLSELPWQQLMVQRKILHKYQLNQIFVEN